MKNRASDDQTIFVSLIGQLVKHVCVRSAFRYRTSNVPSPDFADLCIIFTSQGDPSDGACHAMREGSSLTGYDSTNVRFMNASFLRVFPADIHQCT